MSEMHRITSRPDQLGGAPCIRGIRIRVAGVIDMLSAGATEESILLSYPYLEPADIQAVREFATKDLSGRCQTPSDQD